ncbi:MAG: nucleotide exchange factor GrpE [Actinomycetota bacterium]|nr:nucleotide exchange factor GrpE [Acidimicrobiales bacterium]MEC9339573.1 nucleotide exchange factor GrpE [Actinomycetota bacterium]MED6304091.1 nucleotide exchange factor GrpE [Actinomycetota bacterium]
MTEDEIDGSEQTQLDLAVDEADDSPTDSDASNVEPEEPLSVEELIEALERVTAERDDHRDSLQRLQAEFENFRRRRSGEMKQQIADGVSQLAEALLPVLDACDAAEAQGLEDVVPIKGSLETALQKYGLVRIEAVGAPFDPNQHEAVLHETGDGGEQVVVEELRPGYRWGQRVMRAAMVKVRD